VPRHFWTYRFTAPHPGEIVTAQLADDTAAEARVSHRNELSGYLEDLALRVDLGAWAHLP
jgi:hypothetical protein